jgi:hypothetical protein
MRIGTGEMNQVTPFTDGSTFTKAILPGRIVVTLLDVGAISVFNTRTSTICVVWLSSPRN